MAGLDIHIRQSECLRKSEASGWAHASPGAGGLAIALDGVEEAARGRFAHADFLQVGRLHMLEVLDPVHTLRVSYASSLLSSPCPCPVWCPVYILQYYSYEYWVSKREYGVKWSSDAGHTHELRLQATKPHARIGHSVTASAYCTSTMCTTVLHSTL